MANNLDYFHCKKIIVLTEDSSKEYCCHTYQIKALVKTFLLNIVSHSAVFCCNLWLQGTSLYAFINCDKNSDRNVGLYFTQRNNKLFNLKVTTVPILNIIAVFFKKVTWRYVEKNVPVFNPISNKCRLCLREKFNIVLRPNMATLNSRQEIFAHCRHLLPELISGAPDWDQDLVWPYD